MPERLPGPAQGGQSAGPPLPAYRTVGVAMDTLVTLEVLSTEPEEQVRAALERARGWFRAVEQACSRFDPSSELRQLLSSVGRPVEVSPLLFEATRFALALAERTQGAFDPTVGHLLEQKGFDRHYLPGERTASGTAPAAPASLR